MSLVGLGTKVSGKGGSWGTWALSCLASLSGKDIAVSIDKTELIPSANVERAILQEVWVRTHLLLLT